MTKRLVCGVGINDANYTVQKKRRVILDNGEKKEKLIWVCPYYEKWTSMLKRCYSKSLQSRRPSYIGCTVCEEWLLFSNFKKWMETKDWQGKQLDKDLLIRGNKIYCPETCIFVSPLVNGFLTESNRSRGEWPIGVHFSNTYKKFCAQSRSLLNGKQVFLGRFDNPEDAYNTWLAYKREQVKILIERIDDPVVAAALVERYKNYDTKQGEDA